MSIRAFVKRIAARYMVIIEFCHDCGVRQPLIWHAPDEAWAAVMQEDGVLGAGIVCPMCFNKRARRNGHLVYWHCALDGYAISTPSLEPAHD